MSDRIQQLVGLIETLLLLKSTSEEAANVFEKVIQSKANAHEGGLAGYLKEITADAKTASATMAILEREIKAVSALPVRAAADETPTSEGARSTPVVSDAARRRKEVQDKLDEEREARRQEIRGANRPAVINRNIERTVNYERLLAQLDQQIDEREDTLRDLIRRTQTKMRTPAKTSRSSSSAADPEYADMKWALTTPDTRPAINYAVTPTGTTYRGGKVSVAQSGGARPPENASVSAIVKYVNTQMRHANPAETRPEIAPIVAELQKLVKEREEATAPADKNRISQQIKQEFKKLSKSSGTLSNTQRQTAQESVIAPIIEALRAVKLDDPVLNVAMSATASNSEIESALSRAIEMLVTKLDDGAIGRVGESALANDAFAELRPAAFDQLLKKLKTAVAQATTRPIVRRDRTTDPGVSGAVEDAFADVGALTVESKRENDIPSSPNALSNTRVFPTFVTRIGAYFSKFRQSMRASLNPSLRYGPEAQGVDTRTGSQIVAGSSSAVFGGGMDVKVQQVVDRLLAQVGDDISKGAMGTARVAGTDVQLPQTLAKMVVEAIQTSSVLSQHTTAMGRMAGNTGPRGALESGDPVQKLLALFAGDLINQYRSTGGVSPDSAQNFMEQTVAPPQEHEVTLALTHALRLRENLTFKRDRADLDTVTASPHMASRYRGDSVAYSKQIQLLDEILKVSEDPEEERALAMRRGQIAVPSSDAPGALTRDQALTVLLRAPIGSVPAMPDAVAPIVQKAQQVSAGLSESGLTVPMRPSYGTSPIQSLVDFYSSGQTQSLERFQPVPLTRQLDEVGDNAPTSGMEQKEIIAVISDAFGLSRQSGSRGNAITGVYYGARAADGAGGIKRGDDLDQSLGGGYRTKNGLQSIVQAAAEMQSYGSTGIPLIDYARLATDTGRTEEDQSMFDQIKAKLPHLGSIGEDQLKELAALDTSMDPQDLIKRVMTLAAPAIRKHLTDLVERQGRAAGMDSDQIEELRRSGESGENVPAGFESAFRVLQMFDPNNINSADVNSEVNKAFSLFSGMLTNVIQPNESMPQLAARLLGRENRLEGTSPAVAQALDDTTGSFNLGRAGGELANSESNEVVGNIYGRSITNQNDLAEALSEYDKIQSEIAELQNNIALKPEEADKITPIIKQKTDQLQQVREKLRIYRAKEPDPIATKFEALSTIVESKDATAEEKTGAIRELALLQTIFNHTGRYVIDESQGFGNGTQEQRLSALLEHNQKVEKLDSLKKQRAALGAGGGSDSREAAVEAVIEGSDVDGEIAAVTKDISARKTADIPARVETFVPNYDEGQSYVNRDATIGAYAGKNPDFREDDPSQDSMAIVHDLEAQTLTAAISDGVSQSHRSNIASRLLSRAATTLPIDTPFTMKNIVDRANASPLSDIEGEIIAAHDLSGVSEGLRRTDEQLTGMSLKLVQTAIQRAKEKAAKEKREATVKDYYEAVSQVQDEASMSDEEYLKYFEPGSAFGSDLSGRRQDLKDKSASSSNATLSAYRRRFNPDTGKYEHSVVRLGDSPIVSPDLKLLPSDTAIGGQPSQTNTGPGGIVINNKPTNPLFEQTYETDQPVGIVLASDAFQDKASTDILSDPSTLHRGTVDQSLLSRVEETPGVYSKKDDRSLIVIGSGAAGPSLSLPGAPETVTAAPETIDEQIARVQSEIAALETPATKLAREAAERGIKGQGEVAGRTYVHPDASHGEPLTYVSRRSTLPLTEDYPQQLSERFAKTGRIDISPEVAGSEAATIVNAAVAETLGLPIGPEVMPAVSEITPTNIPDTSTSNQSSAGAVPYFFVPGQSEPMIVVGQSTGAFKGRGVAAPVMGTVDEGQTQWQAAEREAQEELGVVFDPKADVPVTIAPSTNDAFYMRRVQSISPASAHFETQGVQIVPLSVAISQIKDSRSGNQRDMQAGREALEALQAMVASGEITNDQAESPISNETTEKMQELTAQLAELEAKKQAATEGGNAAEIINQTISEAESRIASLEAEAAETEKLLTLQKVNVTAKERKQKKQKAAEEKQTMEAGLADMQLQTPAFRLSGSDFGISNEEALSIFLELAQQYTTTAPTAQDYSAIDAQIANLNEELKPEDEAANEQRVKLEKLTELAARGFSENIDEHGPAVMQSLSNIGFDTQSGEIAADSFLSGQDASKIVPALISLAPEGEEIDAAQMVTTINELATNKDAQSQLIARMQELGAEEAPLSEKAKERERLQVKKQMMDKFLEEDPSASVANSDIQKMRIADARANNREIQQKELLIEEKQKELDVLAVEDSEDAQTLQNLGVSVSDTGTDSVINAASAEISKIMLQTEEPRQPTTVLAVDQLRQLRNEKTHEYPTENLTLNLPGQTVNLENRLGFEAARQAQGMTGVPTVVPTLEGLLQNPDELLLDKDGKPIILYRGEDADQTAARLGEVPLIYDKSALSSDSLDNPDDVKDVVFPSETPTAGGGAGRYGQGFYHAATKASEDPELATDINRASGIAQGYRGSNQAISAIASNVHVSALKKSANLLDIDQDLETRGKEADDERRRKAGLAPLDSKSSLRIVPQQVIETLYREQVDPDARLRSDILNESEALFAPYPMIGNEPFPDIEAMRGAGVSDSVIERSLELKKEYDQTPSYEDLAVGMGFDAMRYRANLNTGGLDTYLSVFNPGQTVLVAQPVSTSSGSNPEVVTPREQTQVTSTERRAQELQKQLEEQKQLLAALKARSEALKQEAATAPTSGADVTAVAEESKRVADETVKVSAEIKASTEEIQQREVDLDAQIAEAEKAVRLSQQRITALQQEAGGNAGGDEEVYFTVDNTGGSVTLEEKQILDRTSLRPSVRTRMTAPDTGESLFVSNTNVPALVRAAQTVDPTTVDSVLASMTDEEMRRTGMPAAKLDPSLEKRDQELKTLSEKATARVQELYRDTPGADAYYATTSDSDREAMLDASPELAAAVKEIRTKEAEAAKADAERAELWSGARAAAEKEATPEQLVSRLFRQSEKAVQEYADEFTTVPEFTARDIVGQLVSSAIAQTSADAPATSPEAGRAIGETLTTMETEGLPTLSGGGGTMGEKKKRRSPAAVVREATKKYTSGAIKAARSTVKRYSGRTDLTQEQKRKLSAARQKLHAHALQKLTANFGDNSGVMQIANTVAGLTPPDWAADPVQSARVSAISEAMGNLNMFSLEKLRGVDLRNPVEMDRLSKDKDLGPIMEMLASQDIGQALNFKSGTQEYDTARGVLDAIGKAKAAIVEETGGTTDAEEKKKLFFDLETTYGTDAATRKIYQAASGSEGGDVEEMFAVPVGTSAKSIEEVVADTTLTDDEKRKRIRKLALKRLGKKSYVEGTDVNSKVIDRLVEHAMSGGKVYTQGEIKKRLKGQIADASAVVGHNIAAFDLPAVYDDAVPTDVEAKTEDTLLMSRQAYPGSHTLSDTYMAVTGNPLIDAHDAAVDTRAVQDIYPSLASDEERKKLRARYLASKGVAPDSTIAKLADIPELATITDEAEKKRAFEQVGAAYTYYRPLAEMQDFTKKVVRSGGVTRIKGADAKQQAELFDNMNKMFGTHIKEKYGDDQTVETLDDKQLGELVGHITDTYITPNAVNSVDGDYSGMAQMLAGKMGGAFKMKGFDRSKALIDLKAGALDSRIAPGAMPGLSYNPAATRETVGESIADLAAGKSTTAKTTTGGTGKPPGGGAGVSSSAGPASPGGPGGTGGSGFSSIGQATIDTLHAQSVAIEINGGTVNIHANFTDSAASKMTKSLVYISNKDGMNVNGDVTGMGGGGGGYRRVSPADRASFNVLDATKNDAAARLRDETDPSARDALRQSLVRASERTIDEVIKPKAAKVLNAAQQSVFSSLSMGPEEALVSYNEMAQYNLNDLSTELATQEALPEGTSGRDTEIERLKAEIAAVEELINALTELNAIEQRVGSASGTRNVTSPYGTSSGTGTGGAASKYYSRKAKEDEQVLLQLARNSFDQSGGSLGISGGGTTSGSRNFLTDLTRKTAATMINSSGLQDTGTAADIAAVAATSPELQTQYDEATKKLQGFAAKVGGPITEIADDLFELVTGLEAVKATLTPLAATSPEAAAALQVVQGAIDEASAAGKEQRATGGVLEADNRKKVSLVEEQMQAAASRPGFFAGGRREREMRQIQEGYIRDTFGQQGLDALMHRGRLRAYTATGKRVDMAQATVQEQRDTVDRLQKQGINITAEDMTGIARMSGRVEQTKRSAPMGDKLFYAASKIRDSQTVIQTVLDTVASIPNIPSMIGSTIQQFAGSATGSNRIATTARGLALNPENYAQALKAADEQRKQFGGSLTSNLGQVSSFIPLSNAYNVDIGKSVKVARKLASFDPAQGMEGASIAIKEFLSGNVSSLSRRFEINRSALSKINTGDASQMLDSLDSVLAGMGVTDRLIDEQANAMATKYDKMVGNLESLQISLSTGMVNMITPALEGLIGEQSYFGKNVKEKSLNTILKETITSYGDDVLSDPKTGLQSVNIGGSLTTFTSEMDTVLEGANRRMAGEAGRYNSATGGSVSVPGYRLLGNMKPEERASIQFDALLGQAQGMNSTQALMQAMRNNPGDYNSGPEYMNQRESIKTKDVKVDPVAYAAAYKQAEAGLLLADKGGFTMDDLGYMSLGGGSATPNFNAKPKKDTPLTTKGKIRRQIDADTYEVEVPGQEGLLTVRTGGLDAQEKGTRAELASKVGGADILGMDRAMVGGEYAPGQGPDITLLGSLKNIDENNRVVAQMLNKEGKNYSLEMIAKGDASVAFTEGMDQKTVDNLRYIEKVAADAGAGSQNSVTRDLKLGGVPEISQEVRDTYFRDKYLMGIGAATAGGGVAGYGSLMAAGAITGQGTSFAALTAGSLGVGVLGAGAMVAGGAAVIGGGYLLGAGIADRMDSSPEKMRELYRMQAELNLERSKMEVFSQFADQANQSVGRGENYVGGAAFRTGDATNDLLRRDGTTAAKARDKVMQESTAAMGKVYVGFYDEAIKTGQERYATADDSTKKILERQIQDPITGNIMSYVDYEAQVIALKKTADQDPASYERFNRSREELLAPIDQTGALIQNQKFVDEGVKYGTRLNKRDLAEAKAAPLREDIRDLTEKRDNAFEAGAIQEGQKYQKQIQEATDKIEAITYTKDAWDAIPEAARYLIMSAEEVAKMNASEIRFAADATRKELLNPTDYKRNAINFQEGMMDRTFQRRQQRVDTTLTAFARQAIMGLGERAAPNLTANEVGSSGGAGLVIDNTPEARAVRMAQRSGLMPRNRAGSETTVQMLTEAQKAAVAEQQDIGRTNRQIGLANAPEAQLLKSGFTNFAMYMNLAGSTAQDLGRSFMDTMNIMSEGNPRYGLDLAQQMTGFSYDSMIGMQLRPRGNDEKGNPISSLNGLNGQPYSGSGPMVMPYTSGPRGTMAYSRDMMAVNAKGVREGALGIAPSQWQQFVSNATNANAELQRRGMSNAIQERDLNKNHLRNLEDITRNGMRQLQSIHLNYTRTMQQMTMQADLVKGVTRANAARSIAMAAIDPAAKAALDTQYQAYDMYSQHLGQGDSRNFLKDSGNIAAIAAIDPSLSADISALETTNAAYENSALTDPNRQQLQNEKRDTIEPILTKLRGLIETETDPTRKAELQTALVRLSPDASKTVAAQNATQTWLQQTLGDLITKKQLGQQISDQEFQNQFRPLDIANDAASGAEAFKSKDPLAVFNWSRSSQTMSRGFAQSDIGLAETTNSLAGLLGTGSFFETNTTEAFKQIADVAGSATQGVLYSLDDFETSFQQQMEDALRNFNNQRLDMIQAFADAAVEIASIVPEEMVPIMAATSAFMNTQRQADLLWLSGRTDEANALAYQGMLKLGEVVYGEGGGKEYADEYSANYEEMAGVAARDVPQGDLGKFGVNTEDGWALRVRLTHAGDKKPPVVPTPLPLPPPDGWTQSVGYK